MFNNHVFITLTRAGIKQVQNGQDLDNLSLSESLYVL